MINAGFCSDVGIFSDGSFSIKITGLSGTNDWIIGVWGFVFIGLCAILYCLDVGLIEFLKFETFFFYI